MHVSTLTFAFEVTHEGTFLNVFREDGASDRVGPINFQDPNAVYKAMLIVEETKGQAAPPSKKLRKRARRTEIEIAEDIGGKAQKNSGALPWAKGDVRKKGEHRIEAKTTTRKQYVLKRSELDKIRSECGYGEKPTFIVTFINPETHRKEDQWALTPYEDWHAAHVNQPSEPADSGAVREGGKRSR